MSPTIGAAASPMIVAAITAEVCTKPGQIAWNLEPVAHQSRFSTQWFSGNDASHLRHRDFLKATLRTV